MIKNISELLAEKDFDQLTTSERSIVLSEMTVEDYHRQREMIISARGILTNEAAKLQPSPTIAASALSAMNEKKKGGIIMLFSHKTPTWVAVAACALFFLFLNYSTFFDTELNVENPTYLTEIDTVFIEKIVTEFRDVKEESTAFSPVKKRPNKIFKNVEPPVRDTTPETTSFTDAMLSAELVNYTALLQNHSSSSGVSLENDSITQQFNRTIF